MAVEWKKILIDGDQADNFVDLDDTPAALAGEGGKTVKVNAGGNALEFVTVAGDTDEKAGVSADDTTPGYLNGKLTAGTGITLTENTPGGNETLDIKISDGGVDTTQLAADAVDGTKIEDDAVDTEHLAVGAVDTTALGADSVNGTKLADDAVGSEHIEALSADLDFGGNEATDMAFHNVADDAARNALTPVLGKIVFKVDDLHPYICTSVA